MARARVVKAHKRRLKDGRVVKVKEHRRRMSFGQVLAAAPGYFLNNLASSPLAMKFATGVVAVGVSIVAVAAVTGASFGVASLLVVGGLAAAAHSSMSKSGDWTTKRVIAAPMAAFCDVAFGALPPARPAVGASQPLVEESSLRETAESGTSGSSGSSGSTDSGKKHKRKADAPISADLFSDEMSRLEMPTDPDYDPNGPEGAAAGYDRPGLEFKQPAKLVKNSIEVETLPDGSWQKTGEVVDVDGQVYRFTATNQKSDLTLGKPGTLLWENGNKPSQGAAQKAWKNIFA